MSDLIKVTTSNEHIGKRLDVVLTDILHVVTGKNISRTTIQNSIRSGNVLLDNVIVLNPNTKLKKISNIQINIVENTKTYEIIGEDIQLDIVYEDNYILVINKPVGLVCHPAPGHKSGTLVNALVNKFKLSNINGNTRPGIIHRLDKDTSGLMIVAKTNEAHMAFSNLFANHKGTLIKRKYIAVVFGVPPTNNTRIPQTIITPNKFCMSQSVTPNREFGMQQNITQKLNMPQSVSHHKMNNVISQNKQVEIRTYITRHPKNRQMFTTSDTNGKLAITLYNVQKSFHFSSTKAISVVECELLTGRTHQIRVHMKYIGCPLVGDKLYCKTKIETVYPDYIRQFPRQALHSSTLSFVHPFTKENLNFTSPLPGDINEIILNITNNSS